MKAIMYHYIREYNAQFPFFKFLDIKNFERQLDYFEKEYGFISKEDWFQVIDRKNLRAAQGKVLLTFDDAMMCHYEYVFQVLKKRGLWGIFYVPTQPYNTGKILDVHRIHLLSGAFSGLELIMTLKTHLNKNRIRVATQKELPELAYTKQENYEYVSEFKGILNYHISQELRESLIDAIADDLGFEFSVNDFYIPLEKLKEMQVSGNLIGSHSVSHPLMSNLQESEQREEINDSFCFLSANINEDVKTYCHPYGGFDSFNKTTVKILMDSGVNYSFNVESRDICDDDLISSIQFLPRYDCNEFVFGKSS